MNPTRTSNRTPRLLAMALGLLITGAVTANADNFWNPGPASHASVDGNIVDVQVRVDGSNAPLFFKQGTWDRHYFQAFKGRNYSLVVRNTTSRRVGVLIAVDGLNVVNGEKSNLARNEAMYVLGPWEQAEISGWRTSLNEIRRFVFVDEERSYATRTGQANGDMGWIRVLGFREVEHRAFWPQVRERRYDEGGRELGSNELRDGQRKPSAPAPSAEGRALGGLDKSMARSEKSKASESDDYRAAPQAQDAAPGTGWGDRRYDPVQQTAFEAERSAADRITMRYEYASGLRALGIIPRRARVQERDRGELGFAQPPRW